MVHTAVVHNGIGIVHEIIVYALIVVDVIVDAAIVVERFDSLGCCTAACTCCDCDVTVEGIDPLVM